MASPKKKKPVGRWTEPMGELHVLLAKAFPQHRTAKYQVLDVDWLARQLKVSDEGVYNWLRTNSLPMVRARQIVKVKGCKIKLDDLLTFVS